jgi:hypothetical protein
MRMMINPRIAATIRLIAFHHHPNVGVWAVAFAKRKAQILLDICALYSPSTEGDIQTLEWAAEALADSTQWAAEDIANIAMNSGTPADKWQELRSVGSIEP